MLKQARDSGDLRTVKRVLAVLAVSDGTTYSLIAKTLRVNEESIRLWINIVLLKGVKDLKSNKSPGRPSKLTKTQRKELDKLITEGPAKAASPEPDGAAL